jgi:hypothetical protein
MKDKKSLHDAESPRHQSERGNRDRVQKAFKGELVLGSDKVIKSDDFTVFVPREDFIKAVEDAFKGPNQSGGSTKGAPSDSIPKLSDSQDTCPETIDLSGKVCLKRNLNPDAEPRIKPKICRVHAALCFDAEYYSVTIREELGAEEWKPVKRFQNNFKWEDVQSSLKFSGIKPDSWTPKEGFASSLYSLSDILFPAIFGKDRKVASGLVLITGGTGTGKTSVLNGLLARYIWSLLYPKPKRRPHIVAAGDPVETLFYAKRDSSLTERGESQKLGKREYLLRPIDYTARVLGTDVVDVQHALKDALRETPSAFVMSELREDDDFKATLNFAATGQLVFATAHNTSLVDALRKLMMISGLGDHASARSILAQRLRAVIHLQQIQITKDQIAKHQSPKDPATKDLSITLPTAWLGNASGIRNFVCDGLASLLPHGPHHPDRPDSSNPDEAHRQGTVGLSWAVNELRTHDLIVSTDGVRSAVKHQAEILDLAIR